MERYDRRDRALYIARLIIIQHIRYLIKQNKNILNKSPEKNTI